jgi:hypothetical protein
MIRQSSGRKALVVYVPDGGERLMPSYTMVQNVPSRLLCAERPVCTQCLVHNPQVSVRLTETPQSYSRSSAFSLRPTVSWLNRRCAVGMLHTESPVRECLRYLYIEGSFDNGSALGRLARIMLCDILSCRLVLLSGPDRTKEVMWEFLD